MEYKKIFRICAIIGVPLLLIGLFLFLADFMMFIGIISYFLGMILILVAIASKHGIK